MFWFCHEYRIPLNDKYKFKLGASIGENIRAFPDYKVNIISASDSLIVERRFGEKTQIGGLRVGGEKKLGKSMFSLMGDLNISYQKAYFSNYNTTHELIDGIWQAIPPEYELISEGLAMNQGTTTRHFITPSLRVGISLDVPLNKYFMLNLYAAGNFGIPILIDETNKKDPLNEFSTVPTVFDAHQQFGGGVRFMLPVRNK